MQEKLIILMITSVINEKKVTIQKLYMVIESVMICLFYIY